jgi:hypothetical protein
MQGMTAWERVKGIQSDDYKYNGYRYLDGIHRTAHVVYFLIKPSRARAPGKHFGNFSGRMEVSSLSLWISGLMD